MLIKVHQKYSRKKKNKKKEVNKQKSFCLVEIVNYIRQTNNLCDKNVMEGKTDN